MTVIEGPKLENYLDSLIDKYKLHIDETKNNDAIQSHNLMIDIINNEKSFLKNSENPNLSIDLNGLPSVDSLAADLESIEKFSSDNLDITYAKNIQTYSKFNYVDSNESNYNRKINQKDKKLIKKTSFSIDRVENSFSLTTLEEHFVEGFDEISKTTPLAKKTVSTKYQIALDTLLSKTETSYKTLEDILPKKKNEISLVKEDNMTNNLEAVKYMGESSVNGLVKFGKGSLTVSKHISKAFFFNPSCLVDLKIERGSDEIFYFIIPCLKVFASIGLGAMSHEFFNILPYYLAADIGTNTLSGLYEWHKHAKNKVKSKKDLKKWDKEFL